MTNCSLKMGSWIVTKGELAFEIEAGYGDSRQVAAFFFLR